MWCIKPNRLTALRLPPTVVVLLFIISISLKLLRRWLTYIDGSSDGNSWHAIYIITASNNSPEQLFSLSLSPLLLLQRGASAFTTICASTYKCNSSSGGL